jgi:acid phosphatase
MANPDVANLAFLASKGITLTNHYAVTHPSQPNYIAAIGGDYFGMANDDFLSVDANVTTLIDLLEQKGISWSEYQEDQPYSGFEGMGWVNQQDGRTDYVRKHNPAVIYNANAAVEDRLAKIKNLTMFFEDLKNNTLPQWMFITPNMTSDGHDTSITVAGTWTRTFVEPLLNDTRFMNNTLVLITFDENSSYAKQNKILGILLGDAVPAALAGTTDSNFYNHYSEIASVQANWGLDSLGRWDVGANVWALVANKTGDVIRTWSDKAVPLAQMYWNQSYDGVMNPKPVKPIYPAPNVFLKHGNRTVFQPIVDLWKNTTLATYYEDKIEIPDGRNPPNATALAVTTQPTTTQTGPSSTGTSSPPPSNTPKPGAAGVVRPSSLLAGVALVVMAAAML